MGSPCLHWQHPRKKVLLSAARLHNIVPIAVQNHCTQQKSQSLGAPKHAKCRKLGVFLFFTQMFFSLEHPSIFFRSWENEFLEIEKCAWKTKCSDQRTAEMERGHGQWKPQVEKTKKSQRLQSNMKNCKSLCELQLVINYYLLLMDNCLG